MKSLTFSNARDIPTPCYSLSIAHSLNMLLDKDNNGCNILNHKLKFVGNTKLHVLVIKSRKKLYILSELRHVGAVSRLGTQSYRILMDSTLLTIFANIPLK